MRASKPVLDKLPNIDRHEHDPIEAAEGIITGTPNPSEIQYGGSKAFYSSITDCVTLLPRELFISAEEFMGPRCMNVFITPTSGLCRVAEAKHRATLNSSGECRHNTAPLWPNFIA